MITDEEKEVMELTADVWNKYKQLPADHPDDIIDFKFYLHALQNIILSRSAYRELKIIKDDNTHRTT